jgi:hypothetical protein
VAEDKAAESNLGVGCVDVCELVSGFLAGGVVVCVLAFPAIARDKNKAQSTLLLRSIIG